MNETVFTAICDKSTTEKGMKMNTRHSPYDNLKNLSNNGTRMVKLFCDTRVK
jgi:hypothetical protein